MAAVEASPDGTKLFVGGSFNTVNGVAKQKVASLNLTTGAPLTTFGFTNSTNNQVQSLAATNSTALRRRPVHPDQRRAQDRPGRGERRVRRGRHRRFDNDLAGGIGVNGQLGVPQLKLTHDDSKLLVVHTGRQIDGQDRLGMGIIDTAHQAAAALAQPAVGREPGPRRWRHPHLRRRHRARRLLLRRDAAARAATRRRSATPRSPTRSTPRRSRTPTSSRCGSPGTSTASTRWPSPSRRSTSAATSASSSRRPPTTRGPGLDNVGYGTGQGLAGYGLGDQVVRRDHIAALDPDRRARRSSGTRRRVELVRGQQGHGGHLARPVHRRRRHVPGRRPHRPGRVLRLQHGAVPAGRCPTPRSPPRSRAGSSPTTRRSRSPAPRGSPPAPSAGSRSRSRTATAASTSRTTAPRSPRSAAPPTRSTPRSAPGTGTTRTWSHGPAAASPPTATCWSRRRRSPPPPVAPATRPRRPRRSSRSAPTTRPRRPPSAGRAASRPSTTLHR